jgi:carbohydrate diacid regulator
MQLGKELARQIRDKAKTILNREVAIAGANGQVLVGPLGTGQTVSEALKAAQDGTKTTGKLGPHQVEWLPFVYEDKIVGVFGIISDESSVAGETLGLLQGLAEVIVHQYMLLDKLQSTETMRSNFVRELLQSSKLDSDDAYHQADILQLNLRQPQSVILAHLQNFESGVQSSTAHLSPEEQRMELLREIERVILHIDEGFQNFPDNIITYIGDDTFVLLKGIGGGSPNTLNTIRFLNEKGHFLHDTLSKLQHVYVITVGVGQYYPNLGGLRKSYQDAKLAVEVGGKVWGHGKVYHVKDVGMFVTLANIAQERKAELAHQILHPLLRDQQLYKTVRMFLENGLNLTDAAKMLHIHRNTLIYRLDKTKKLIGLDPRHFDDALQIKLGLMFYQPSTL